MRTIGVVFFSAIATFSQAQTLPAAANNFERKGFFFSAAVGASSIGLKLPGQPAQQEITASLPNFKVGKMLTHRTALLVSLPGSLYTYKGAGRKRDRGFEAIVPSVQYWIQDRWWVLGGAGLGMDAPAFYDIKNEEETTFYFGRAVAVGTGYELWRKGNMAVDIQSRVQYGAIKVPDGTRTGLAVSLLVGLNLY